MPPRKSKSGERDAPAEPAAQQQQPTVAKTPVLPWMRVPITIEQGRGVPLPEVHGLAPELAAALAKGLHFEELFPVQAAVWSELAGGASSAHDLCIAAPTGSGKTLAYALPVVNGLARQSRGGSLHCLQALVVLPTRDLASQVHAVFQALCPAVGLTLGLAAAQKSVAAEAAAISDPGLSTGAEVEWDLVPLHANALGPATIGMVDVLVATPGRLMAHLQSTPGFTLRHLKYLVVDETDRLLRQSYQEWLPRVLSDISQSHYQSDMLACAEDASIWSGQMPYSRQRVVKLVVSATLTRDPSKLARLALHCPRYIATSAQDHRYHVPRSLQEFKVLCAGSQKPQALLALLEELQGQSTVVFTSSLDTTHKLYLMLEAAHPRPEEVVEFSSHVDVKKRAQSLMRFKSGSAKVLVASDAMTRGMDVEVISNVINYDAPVYVKTYVHRAGRAARAGRSGRVVTMLRPEDVRHFKQMLRKADNTFVKDYKLAKDKVDACGPRVSQALRQVQELLEAEAKEDQATVAAAGAAPSKAPTST